MTAFDTTLDGLDWNAIGRRLDADGFAMLPGLLGTDAALGLARQAALFGGGRTMLQADGLGHGEALYFDAGLPTLLEAWRTALYRHLVIVADRWSETLGIAHRYPRELEAFLRSNRDAGQTRTQSYMSRLGIGDHVVLHQRNEGEQVFPLQVVAVLSEPGVDFQGGAFVTTEQRPRMQSRPAVLPLRLGDMAVIATAQRPFQGAQGYYRVNLKHAISRVSQGERIGLELSFHNAR